MRNVGYNLVHSRVLEVMVPGPMRRFTLLLVVLVAVLVPISGAQGTAVVRAVRLARAAEDMEKLLKLTRTLGTTQSVELPAAIGRLERTTTGDVLMRGLQSGNTLETLLPSVSNELGRELEKINQAAAIAAQDARPPRPRPFCEVVLLTKIACQTLQISQSIHDQLAALQSCDAECSQEKTNTELKVKNQLQRLAQQSKEWQHIQLGVSVTECLTSGNPCDCLDLAEAQCGGSAPGQESFPF